MSEMAADYLTGEGFEIFSVYSGREAMEMLGRVTQYRNDSIEQIIGIKDLKIYTAVLVVCLMQPIIGREPTVMDFVIKLGIVLIVSAIGVSCTLKTKIHELG